VITVALFNLCVIFYAYLARNKHNEFWLRVSFALIFLFLALRYDYGNDYSGYLKRFQEINRVTTINYFDEYWGFEAGWVFLCRLFKPFGFFAMTAILALLNCVVYYRFIKKYVPPSYYWLAVFLYVFNPGFMLIHSSAMRQSLAIIVFIFSIDYIYKKKAIHYCLCIAIASLFHTSALILFPVYLLGLYNWKINKKLAVVLFTLFLLLYAYGDIFLPNINQFISAYFGRYEIYEGGGEISSGLGVIIYSFLFALILFYEQTQSVAIALLFKIAILSYFIMPLGLSILMISRTGMYFQPATIVVFPIILFKMNNSVVKNIILTALILIMTYSFFQFFQSDVWQETFGTYNTIFSAPEIL
jgi:hypothetical protein